MRYVLDTSALLAFYQDETGAATVAGIFEARDRGEATIFVSFMTIFELAYVALARDGVDNASALLFRARGLALEEIWPDDELLWQAAEVKARGGLSAADSFVAASALAADAVLVHRDSEFDRLGPEVPRLSLESTDSA